MENDGSRVAGVRRLDTLGVRCQWAASTTSVDAGALAPSQRLPRRTLAIS
jgi:hypothetical protein